MLERMWSGWRASYVSSAPSRIADESASVFTQILDSGLPDEETHVVHRSSTCFVVMNAHPYTSGHLLVVPFREVRDLTDLDDAETTDLWATVTDSVVAVRAAYEPHGVNVGMNLGRPAGGSVPGHLHVHVVPRWTGDTNFMATIANTQTIPESLSSSATRVRDAWS
jgi:ATP adenylyltransferase